MEKAVQKKKTRFMRFLDKVEIIGNKLPQPVSLFGILAIVVVLISGIGGLLNWSATGELYDSATGQMTMQTVNVVSLMNSTGVRYMLTTAVNNFVTYAPLGVVLTLFFGIGVADGSGFLAVIIRKLVQATPKWMICPLSCSSASAPTSCPARPS
nr:AbgT family transporter [Enterocloster asparagiformis]